MTTRQYSIRYPRNVFVRRLIISIGRFLMWLLTRTTIRGREHMPRDGAFILVGNHVAALEVPLMLLYAPRQLEIIEPGDFPVDPSQQWISGLWGGGVPVRQGGIDTRGLNMALDVLAQGGILGLFPEGGIWEASLKDAHGGAAWLSLRAGVPIVPVGFGGTTGAIRAGFRLQRPRITMNIGAPIYPPADSSGRARKTDLKTMTEQVMTAIEALVPAEEKQRWQQITDETFDFQITLRAREGSRVPVPTALELTYPAEVGKFFHRPVLLRTLERNLRLPVVPLRHLDSEFDPTRLAEALAVTLEYLTTTNPGFLPYRFGQETAAAMLAGLRQIHTLALWAAEHDCALLLTPIRRYRYVYSSTLRVETVPGAATE